MTRQVRCVGKYRLRMWKRYRESGVFNDLVKYRRALRATTKAYKETESKFEEKNCLSL